MGIRKVSGNRQQPTERFIFETDEERKILDQAREYFSSANTLMAEGLEYRKSRWAASQFANIRKGKDNRNPRSISIKDWERVKEYASLFIKRETYDPDTFKRYEPKV